MLQIHMWSNLIHGAGMNAQVRAESGTNARGARGTPVAHYSEWRPKQMNRRTEVREGLTPARVEISCQIR